ncbi:hypothetical protein EXM22_15670 [Oceanispirochaeta crateris]|uniref:Uncharacterized protein n=1 Tax=Oceanispirochaeta crateris TaxID=2518645 RepID=A0A5C1QRU3_9SPIO|nr:hypothetical protein [Oceanispirochaeta crateris]QEN09344.1 hypothetical protein EXM22_15670 [Oceanispirochaeta crateris]
MSGLLPNREQSFFKGGGRISVGMFIDSFYILEFKFDKNSEGLDHLFPSMELLIRSLENIDRCLVSTVGYSLEYKRYLRNIGEESFTFSIRVRLFQPEQIALGQDFLTENVLNWMQQGRQVFIDASNDPIESPSDLLVSLHPLVSKFNLVHSILYKDLVEDEVNSLSQDLSNAVSFLGGKVLIS